MSRKAKADALLIPVLFRKKRHGCEAMPFFAGAPA
jgi:hypothetical protein